MGTNYFQTSHARAVLNLLGLPSAQALSRLSGVAHDTVSSLLYKPTAKATYFSATFKVYMALADQYHDVAPRLARSAQKVIEQFLDTWIDYVLDNTASRHRDAYDPRGKNERQRELRRKKGIEQRRLKVNQVRWWGRMSHPLLKLVERP